MSTGIAMIARNAEGQMQQALAPFVGHQMAIVLGGISSDNTAKIAAEYGKVAEFAGPLDNEGRLLDFGAARQQSFDMLATDWTILVDSDDIWEGVEHLPNLIAYANEQQAGTIFVPHIRGQRHRGQLTHARLFRRESGYWVGAVHEYWKTDAPAIGTDALRVSQIYRTEEINRQRIDQNITILNHQLSSDPTNRRAWAHLIQDYIHGGQFDKALEAVENYLALETEEPDKDREYYVLYQAGLCLSIQKKYSQAIEILFRAIGLQDYGRAWTLLANVALEQGQLNDSPGLYDLAIMAAEAALARGKDRARFPADFFMTLIAPHHIKARAMIGRGQYRQALATIDQALMLEPENKDMLEMRQSLCTELGVIP